MNSYKQLVSRIINDGTHKYNRTGVDTLSLFGQTIRHNILLDGFPLLTTKKIDFKNIKAELLWFLKGTPNLSWLQQFTKIWNPWANDFNDVDYCYGSYWRSYPTHSGFIDQIKYIVNTLKEDPNSRRMVLTAWHPGAATKKLKAPPACHTMAIFNTEGHLLNCHLTMRSTDVGLGLPYNIASYALLTSMLAQVTDLTAHEIMITMVDCHIYENHMDGLSRQIQRPCLQLPNLKLNPKVKDIDAFEMSDIEIEGYSSHGAIPLEPAV